ncbi:rhodanese-like domain-containing protein [Lignipirellula cremea]|uniref:Putative adenylyltransferase/sulfurtransferase MoeZ n=1 Tax=Lignipirellula cremea TaxID=2528010 RepID=A0A518DLE1_9BACT|nr:rhodanese-like domain-containing protein [Lignipirellula cremea]QDU92657.1 putative adenylyltransferase/sulfurtransferase MoeZ [Lignipirellula cremea]
MIPPIRKYALALACTSFLTLGLQAAEPTKDTLETVKSSIAEEKALLLDVREKREWDQGHIVGAVFLPLSELRNGITAEALAERVPKDRIIYTHCAAGVRSCIAADILKNHGYDVRPLKPGYRDLISASFKTAM